MRKRLLPLAILLCCSSFVCAGFEYAITERIHLTAKVDWMFNASNPQPDFVKGPRLYIGFMFCHSR